MQNRTIHIVAFLLIAPLVAVSQTINCSQLQVEQDDFAYPNVAAKKVDFAMAVIARSEYKNKDQGCVRAAMLYLGMAHVNKAIPALISLLGYRQDLGLPTKDGSSHQESRFGHLVRLDEEYPAIAALSNMGKAAVPALIGVIASKAHDTIESRNALNALMNVYREDPSGGISVLREAAEKQTDSAPRARLDQATQDARSQWCKSSPCGE